MKKRILFVVFPLIGLFAAAFIASGQQTNQTNTRPFSDLTFKIAPTRETFLLMEPITLNISLSNDTASPIPGHQYIDFNGLFVDLDVTNQNGDKMRISSLPTLRAMKEGIENKPIPPNQRFEVTDVFYTMHRYFPDTGTYKLEATLRDATGQQEIKSEPVIIKIIEPTGRDRLAYNFLKTKTVRPFFFNGDVRDNEGFKHLENIANQFGDTNYGDYAGFVIANKYRFRGDNVRAKTMLQRLLLRPNFVFIEGARRLLAQIERTEQNQQ